MYYKFARKEKGSETLKERFSKWIFAWAELRKIYTWPEEAGFTAIGGLLLSDRLCCDTRQLRRQPTSNTDVPCQKESVLFEIIFMSFWANLKIRMSPKKEGSGGGVP